MGSDHQPKLQLRSNDIRSYFSCRPNISPEITIVKCPEDGNWPDPILVKEELFSSAPITNHQNSDLWIHDEFLSSSLSSRDSSNEHKHNSGSLIDNIYHSYEPEKEFPKNPDQQLFDSELHKEIVIKEEYEDQVSYESDGDSYPNNGIENLNLLEEQNLSLKLECNKPDEDVTDSRDKIQIRIEKNQNDTEKLEASFSNDDCMNQNENIGQICSIQNVFSGTLKCQVCNTNYGSFRAYYVHMTRHHSTDEYEAESIPRKSKVVGAIPLSANKESLERSVDMPTSIVAKVMEKSSRETLIKIPTESSISKKNVYKSNEKAQNGPICIIVNDPNQVRQVGGSAEISIVNAFCKKKSLKENTQEEPIQTEINPVNLTNKSRYSDARESNETILSDEEEDDSGIFMDNSNDCSFESNISSNYEYDKNLSIKSDLAALDNAKNICPITSDFKAMNISRDETIHENSPVTQVSANCPKALELPKTQLINHIDLTSIHSGEKEISCKLCKFRTQSVDQLNEHVKHVHHVSKQKVRN